MPPTVQTAGLRVITTLMCFLATVAVAAPLPGAELLVGGATVSITPDAPIALAGQFATRIGRTVDNPLTATVFVLESRQGDTVLDSAVMVSCDLVAIKATIRADLRRKLAQRLPDLDVEKVILSATHTHTGPVMEEGLYKIEGDNVMRPSRYVEFLVERLTELVVEVWESRRAGGVSWALGHAVVGHNRRVVYADGTAQMYGSTTRPDFRHFEGYEDHGIEMLFLWDADSKPLGVAINVACPSQEVEGRSTVNADFWHDVRLRLQKRYGEDFLVLAWTGAAGDLSPHHQYRKRAEQRMRELRGLTPTEEIARRLAAAVDDVFPLAEKDIRFDLPLSHHVETLALPLRRVTEEEYAAAKGRQDELAAKSSPTTADFRRGKWYADVADRYERQDDQPTHEIELHVVRIGDIAVATNPFEMFLDFGIRIKVRSPAVQTFIVQLAGKGTYLATERAVRGGGYSAVIESTHVGPEGGQMLVDRTVEIVKQMWASP